MLWFIGLLVIGVIAVLLIWWLDPTLRRFRSFEAELAGREPLSDAELVARYFGDAAIPPHVPTIVREVFGKHMDYPAQKLLPDDDLSFFWDEVDMVELVSDLEARFGITITDADAERTSCDIRSVALLVAAKLPVTDSATTGNR